MERAVPSVKWKTTASAACIPRRDSTSPYSMAATVLPTASRIVCSLFSGLGGPIILGCSPLLACWLSIRAPFASCGRPLPSDTAHLTLAWPCPTRPGTLKRRRQGRYKLPATAYPNYRSLVGINLSAAPGTPGLRPALQELRLRDGLAVPPCRVDLPRYRVTNCRQQPAAPLAAVAPARSGLEGLYASFQGGSAHSSSPQVRVMCMGRPHVAQYVFSPPEASSWGSTNTISKGLLSSSGPKPHSGQGPAQPFSRRSTRPARPLNTATPPFRLL